MCHQFIKRPPADDTQVTERPGADWQGSLLPAACSGGHMHQGQRRWRVPGKIGTAASQWSVGDAREPRPRANGSLQPAVELAASKTRHAALEAEYSCSMHMAGLDRRSARVTPDRHDNLISGIGEPRAEMRRWQGSRDGSRARNN